MHLIAIRAEPGLSATIEKARAMGLEISGEPLFEAQSCQWNPADFVHCDAILAGSANLFRHGGEGLDRLKHLPVHAVGEATAQAAQSHGFKASQTGDGAMQDILDRPENAGLYYARLMGRDHTLLAPHLGQNISEVAVYEMAAIPASRALLNMCSQGALVLLHSARSAQHFAGEIDQADIARGHIGVAALSQPILDAVGQGWQVQISAPIPTDQALLDTAAEYLKG